MFHTQAAMSKLTGLPHVYKMHILHVFHSHKLYMCITLCFTCVSHCASHVYHACFTCVSHCASHVYHACFACVSHCASHVYHVWFTCVSHCASHVYHVCFTCVSHCASRIASRIYNAYISHRFMLACDSYVFNCILYVKFKLT